MKIGASLALIAIGAILKFAVTKSADWISVPTVGVICMIIGGLGLIITLALMFSRRRTDVVYGRNGVTYMEPHDREYTRY
jgi:hypothetical protein